MFDFNLGDDFKYVLSRIEKRNPKIATAVNRKIREIISRDKNSINIYKNLKHDFKHYKRVHITKTLIMIFHVDIEHNHIIFISLKHRDDAYKR